MTESTFVVPGMHCDHCKAAVDNQIRMVVGVEDVRAAIAVAGYEVA